LWGILTGTCLSAAPPIHIPIIFPFYLPHFNTPPQNLQSPLGRDVNRLSTRSTPTLRPPHTCHLSSVILKRHSSLTVASSSSRSMAAATFWTCRGHARIRPELPPIVHTHCRGASAARAGPSPSASALLRKHTPSPCGRRTFTTYHHSSPLITTETRFDFPFGNTSKFWGSRIAHYKELWKCFFFYCETRCRKKLKFVRNTTFVRNTWYASRECCDGRECCALGGRNVEGQDYSYNMFIAVISLCMQEPRFFQHFPACLFSRLIWRLVFLLLFVEKILCPCNEHFFFFG